MLGVISEKSEIQILYLLDAKLFWVKMIEVTCYNLNQMEETKYLAAINEQEKNKTAKDAQNDPKKIVYEMPTYTEDWVNFSFPKDLIDKIDDNEDSTVICKFAFEYPELSYYYMDRVVTILEKYGMHIHCVPIYWLMRLFANSILSNQF